VKDAEAGGYRMQDFIVGIALSDAFRMTKVPAAAPNSGSQQQ
jgi:hypothetical protein